MNSLKRSKQTRLSLPGSKTKRWPDDYIGSQKDIWAKIDVAKYLEEERNSWHEEDIKETGTARP